VRLTALFTLFLTLGAQLACSDLKSADDSGQSFAEIERVPVDQAALLDEHNRVRADKGLAPFTWDAGLAADSEDWSARLAAEGCGLEHSSGSWGENLYWTSATATPADVVGAWAEEEAFYDYASNSCEPGQMCGHYTQIVWDDTERVGCGAARCPDDGGEIWTCRYDPPGNWVGEKPY
jgi:uncharacterized protein YkwD